MRVRLILSAEGAQRTTVVQPTYPLPIPLGCVVGTEAALRLLADSGVNLDEILANHRAYYMMVGDVPEAGQDGPADAPTRALSAYEIEGRRRKLWVLTDLERGLTVLLLPNEYRRAAAAGG